MLLALVKTPVEQLIERAFAARPELAPGGLPEAHHGDGGEQGLLGLFPNSTSSAGGSCDSNHYLLNNTWNEVGAGLSLGC